MAALVPHVPLHLSLPHKHLPFVKEKGKEDDGMKRKGGEKGKREREERKGGEKGRREREGMKGMRGGGERGGGEVRRRGGRKGR